MKSARYAVERVTPPDAWPVTVDELADWMGDSDLSTDPLLPGIISAATDAAERYTQMSFLVAEYREVQDAAPGSGEDWWDGVREGPITQVVPVPSTIMLHRYPVQSVTSVAFYDDADDDTTAAAASYYVDTRRRDPRIVLRSGYSWPSVVLRVANAVEVHFMAGYGAAGDVPEAIKTAIKALAAYLYDHRGACSTEQALNQSGAAGMLAQYRPTRV